MRKLTTILAAFALYFSASSFTVNNDVTKKVKTEFQKDFNSAMYVSWRQDEGVYFATFKMKDQDFSAAYNDEGELLGVSRTIAIDQLPLSVSIAMQKQYSGYSFNESVLELNYNGETTYYLEAENAKYKLNITSNSSGSLTVQKRIKKIILL